ncbi:MAG TPA: DUF3551 domain-containing protein [Xanthobacteraceae bacterium]|nr:DUF3551 domain-containing protein [Xanthobacteraceae bacterium]
MRTAALILTMTAGVLFQTAPAAAQSAYSYPWCALSGARSGAQSCYFRTYAECMATLEGIGGSCIRSPYFHGPERGWRRY